MGQKEFEECYTASDGVTGEPFEFVKGDQRMRGQADREPGIPTQASTAFGTASRALKDVLGTLCDGSHEHQPVIGRNAFGNRSAQKSVWSEEICEKIILATIEDIKEKSDMVAYPAAYREERRADEGPIDDPDDGPPDLVGAELPEAEEQEQELLDGFILPGMQDDEQTRKINWMKLPRRVRRALRRLRHMLGHKPVSVMKVIMEAGGAPLEELAGL